MKTVAYLGESKKEADRVWDRSYQSFLKDRDPNLILFALDFCNRIDTALMEEESRQRFWKIYYSSPEIDPEVMRKNEMENKRIEDYRILLLKIVRELAHETK